MNQKSKIVIKSTTRTHRVLIMAPHGGNIEPGTSEIAHCLAGNEYSFYSYMCTGDERTCAAYHIPSHLFHEPKGVALASTSLLIITIHGFKGKSKKAIIGGLYKSDRLIQNLHKAGFLAETAELYPRISGKDPNNICNRGILKKGIQIELAIGLRALLLSNSKLRHAFKNAVTDFIEHELQKSRMG